MPASVCASTATAEIAPPVTAADVAVALIGRLGTMTAMKLQKLTYYVQAVQLRRTGEVAFDDDFQAWRDGPVVRSLYDQHRGMLQVDASDLVGDGSVAEGQLADVLTTVASRYGDLDAEDLSDITHREEPWRVTREGLPSEANSERVIARQLMRRFYAAQSRPDRMDLVVASARLEGTTYGDAEADVLTRYVHGELSRDAALEALRSAH